MLFLTLYSQLCPQILRAEIFVMAGPRNVSRGDATRGCTSSETILPHLLAKSMRNMSPTAVYRHNAGERLRRRTELLSCPSHFLKISLSSFHASEWMSSLYASVQMQSSSLCLSKRTKPPFKACFSR